ncbi:YesL family protein [Bifidobacterium bombi]|uniref:Drug resistance transporter EmrB/QacA subfamily protein n=1 Tax=Bifidobacterium bombi DSM 19703 TaxID=1341695 RepID=A0A080N2Q6_9BIFI|nr:DUF624 domain-containing protein [Bifidobacterium bombi]KFF31303.1 hypothetical protein BBOMB_0648 [Bifidobacterium bombi DSM 19703]
MQRFAVGYEFICRIIMMVAVVHVAFIVHTALGLVVAGFFPSVAATCSVYRTWILDVADRSWTVKRSWVTFHRAWKTEFASANVFGWPQFLIWALLIWDYWLTMRNDMGTMGVIVSGVLVVVNLVYGLFVFLSWPVRSNFDQGPMWVVRTSLSMVVARPLCSFMVIVLLVIVLWAYRQWPGLMAAFGLAVPMFADMMAVYSWGRLPGMDVHVLEPRETKDSKHKNQNDAPVSSDAGVRR